MKASIMDRVVTALDHNRYLCVALVLALLALMAWGGCQPRTASIVEPGKMVTTLELERELGDARADYERALKRAEAAGADLERQREFRAKALEFAAGLATVAAEKGNPFANPVAAVGGIFQLAALGLAFDNRRKDKIIRENKAA